MSTIPGLETYGSSIPRLGQGVRGGARGLTGLPGAATGSLIPGLPTLSRVPQVTAPRISTPPLINRNTVFADHGAQQAQHDRLNQARDILNRVRNGQLEPKRAQKLLDELQPDERRSLTQEVLKSHAIEGTSAQAQPELQALRYLPLGKSPGATASLDPSRKAGIGANLASDALNTVIGMPAGIALAGKAVGEDVKDIPGNLLRGKGSQNFRHTREELIKPIAQAYAQEYGPLIKHGDFSGIKQHPLRSSA
jgi:hypothetical protein